MLKDEGGSTALGPDRMLTYYEQALQASEDRCPTNLTQYPAAAALKTA